MYARVEPDYLDVLRALADADLLRRAKLGSDAALSVLLARHSDALLRFCRHLSSNHEDAEDIFQETLARAIARVESVQTGSSFRSWLFRIARNLSVDTFRSRKRTCPLPDEETVPLPVHEDGPHDSVETGEEHQTVAQALNRLAESHQRVLMLREVEGLSYAAIAEELNVSQSAVETLLFRARRRLKEEYIKRVAAVPAVAALSAVQDLLARIAAPFVGGPPLMKVAVTAALVGTVAVSTPRFLPRHPAPMLHVPSVQSRVVAPAHRAKSRVAFVTRVHARRHHKVSRHHVGKLRRHSGTRYTVRVRHAGRHVVHRAAPRPHRIHARHRYLSHRTKAKASRHLRAHRGTSPHSPRSFPRTTIPTRKPAHVPAGSRAPANVQPPPPPPSSSVAVAPAAPDSIRPTSDTTGKEPSTMSQPSTLPATSTPAQESRPVDGSGYVAPLAPGQTPERAAGSTQPTLTQPPSGAMAGESGGAVGAVSESEGSQQAPNDPATSSIPPSTAPPASADNPSGNGDSPSS